ncbi:MAG: hypothetical protein DKINENOH_03716 [bacterium]|nr:hypothetical protein [bacterium]
MLVRMIVCGTGLLILHAAGSLTAQSGNTGPHSVHQAVTQQIISAALREGQAYPMLVELTNLGPRLSGTPQAAAAVELTRQMMERHGFENVRLQPLMVPRWIRGPIEEAAIINSPSHGTVPLAVCALGSSIATPALGLVAEVIEVKSFEELRALGKKAAGKIVFFNRPMDPTRLDTFAGYGGAVDQRGSGAVEAAKVGGVAALVRSMTTANDDVPHTGNTNYEASVAQIPAAALSTRAADFLSQLLAHERSVRVRLRLTCATLPDVPSANVMGELRGAEKPEEIIVLGGHLDSWDKGTGAHDDGAGCMQAIAAVRLLKQLGFRPKRTIRAVMFMNEENGLRGGLEYAREAVAKQIKHVAALESDRGGFAPCGFSIDADSSTAERILSWRDVFAPMKADRLGRGGSGADISPLVKTGVPGLGLIPESHRYFDYHHSDNDTIDKVNPRELELGAAALAIMAYLLSEEL